MPNPKPKKTSKVCTFNKKYIPLHQLKLKKMDILKERVRIGLQIKEIRKSKGMSAKELAIKSGINTANICRIEQGKYSVGLDILSKIAYTLGMKIKFIEP